MMPLGLLHQLLHNLPVMPPDPEGEVTQDIIPRFSTEISQILELPILDQADAVLRTLIQRHMNS
jgi:hypothetical protein